MDLALSTYAHNGEDLNENTKNGRGKEEEWRERAYFSRIFEYRYFEFGALLSWHYEISLCID